MKTCPQCAEQVQDPAKVCRFCGAQLTALGRADHGLRNVGFGGAALLFVALAVMVNKCDGATPPAPPTAADRLVAEQVRVERAVKARLRDPDSAQFRHFANGCGVVNSRNGFGGMGGPERFIVGGTGVTLQEDFTHPLAFDAVWKQKCGITSRVN